MSMDVNDLLKLIAGGENEKVEFKKDFTPAIGEEIVAFANAEGGYILVGVTDDGRIVGCNSKKVIGRITNILMNLVPRIEVKVDVVKINKREVVVIKVPKSKEVVTIGDVAYIRIGKGKRVLSLQEIFWKKVENVEINWDLLPSPVDLDNLDEKKFRRFLEKRYEVRKIPYVGDLLEDLRRSKAIVEKDGKYYLRNGAVLFFTKDPSEFFPQAKIRYAEFTSDMELVYEKEFRGDIIEMIENACSFIASRLGRISYRIGAKREYILEYPEKAIREAIINAFAHRNYTLFSDIRVMKLPDKLVVRSPGSLVPGVDLENPEHIPRNPLICEYLFGMGYIERYGIGINVMRRECERHPLVELEFRKGPTFFEVVFRKSYGKIVDEKDRMIINLLKQGLSVKEISERIGISRSAIYKRLRRLRRLGLYT